MNWVGKLATAARPHIEHPWATYIHLRYRLGGKRNRKIRAAIRREFDDKFYLNAYPELRGTNVGPLLHYIVVGWKEHKDPCEHFSTRAYLETHADVAAKRINPFFHYVTHGRKEGRVAQPSPARRRPARRPATRLRVPRPPTPQDWARRPKRVVEPPTREAVNVVIPVYKSLPHVAATLDSVLSARCETAHECLVVDDCSPEPAVGALLDRLARDGHIRLLRNETNLGFVRSVNRAMESNPHRDVVLLNADTIVHDGWLDRLAAPVHKDPTIATVTPLSNNATLASYPDTSLDNSFELELPSAEIDRLAAEANGGTTVDVPTGVGFCLYIRRAALKAVGLFDAETFGLGYGEETDWCMRALKAGWRNVLATGVYVRHFGSTSFESNPERNREAELRMSRKHPDYDGRVARYFMADLSLPSRMRLDALRLKQRLGGVSVLFVSHNRGGGVQTFLDNAREALVRDGLASVVERALLMQIEPNGHLSIIAFGKGKLPYVPNLHFLNIDRHTDCLADIVRLLDPELIHMNSFAGLGSLTIDRLMSAVQSSGRPYWHVWHDHQPLCPRLNFLDAEDNYCGETNIDLCGPCLAASRARYEWVQIEDWRERFRRYLAGAELVSAPSESAALRARRMVDVSKVKVHPHPQPLFAEVRPMRRPSRSDGLRRVLILGAIGPHKGANLLLAMIRDAAHRDLPLRFELIGFTSEKRIATGPHVTVHGRYNGDEDAARRIRKLQPDLCFASSVVPETFSFILSVAIGLHLPLVAFDIGAAADRIPVYGRGEVLDRRLMADPAAVNDALLALDLDALWSLAPNTAMDGVSALSTRFREAPGPAALERGLAASYESRIGSPAMPRVARKRTGPPAIIYGQGLERPPV